MFYARVNAAVNVVAVAERRGGAQAQFRRNNAFFFALLMHFLPKKNVKERLLRPINEHNNLLRSFGAKSALKERKRMHRFV